MSKLASPTDGDLERHEAEVARLLASLPPRAAEIPEARLQEIVEELADCAAGIFQGRTITASVFAESDPETVACHRIELRVGGAEEVDPLEFAERAFALHQQAATRLSTEEYQAILLHVEPRP